MPGAPELRGPNQNNLIIAHVKLISSSLFVSLHADAAPFRSYITMWMRFNRIRHKERWSLTPPARAFSLSFMHNLHSVQLFSEPDESRMKVDNLQFYLLWWWKIARQKLRSYTNPNFSMRMRSSLNSIPNCFYREKLQQSPPCLSPPQKSLLFSSASQ